MWKTRDITLIIIFAVVGLVYTVIAAQMGYLITGIRGMNFFFIIGHVIFISSQFLLYEGRRWRFFVSTTLFVFLIIPTNFAGAPFDIVARIPLLIQTFFADLVVSTSYGFFESHNKLLWWIIFVSVGYNVSSPLFSLFFYNFFYPPEFVSTFSNTVLLMLPVIVIESIVGGYMGYKVYERVKQRL